MNEASTGNYPALHTIFIIFEGGNELTIVSRKDYGENNTSCRGTYNIEFSTKLTIWHEIGNILHEQLQHLNQL